MQMKLINTKKQLHNTAKCYFNQSPIPKLITKAVATVETICCQAQAGLEEVVQFISIVYIEAPRQTGRQDY